MVGMVVLIALAVVGLAMLQWWWLKLFRPRPAGASAWSDTEHLGESTCLAGGGPWIITFLRQSGNVHRVDQAATAREAVAKVQAAFRRAQIGGVRITDSTPDGFRAWRTIHNGRGSAEGKKLGGAVVARTSVALGSSQPDRPSEGRKTPWHHP